MNDGPILTINSGSSSLKLGIFVPKNGDESALYEALVDGVGKASAKLEVRDAAGKVLYSASPGAVDSQNALREVSKWLAEHFKIAPVAIGHRVVHGGPTLTAHQKITAQLIGELRRSVHFAPLHIPAALALIEAAEEMYGGVPQYACFDTAFHRTLPEVAARFALPADLFQEGVRRYGFHGLSYESIVHALGTTLPERIVIAHLGNGASLAAVRKGISVDTTMGLTPTGGIPMGTRTGDLDPGVVLYLLQNKKIPAGEVEQLLNHGSGLLGLSGKTADMRELERSARQGDHNAQLAIDIFVRSIKKTIGSYTTLFDGLDLLAFTGGIGEHSASVRASICDGLHFLGIQLDAGQNDANTRMISSADSKVKVAVMASEEDRQIARHCRTLSGPTSSEPVH